MSKAKPLETLHAELAKVLLKRVKAGDATAADLSVARQFLKDNNIEVSNLSRAKPLRELAAALPFEEEKTGT